MVHLNVYSSYSFLSSSILIDDLILKAKKEHAFALALTDLNNMFGVMEFVKKCQQNKIKAIIGMEISLYQYEMDYRLILLAKNTQGYYDLLKITALLGKELTIEDLEKYSHDLIVIIPSSRSYLGSCLHKGMEDKALETFNYFKEHFNVYLGLEIYHKNDIDDVNTIRKLFKSEQLVAINNVRSLESDDRTLKALEAIKKNCLLKDIKEDFTQYYYKKQLEMAQVFKEEEIDNSHKIASLIEEYHFDNSIKMIKYCPNSQEYLRNLALKGLNKRLKKQPSKEYLDRLNHELNIIDKMGYNDYFLVVYDYVKFAKNANIAVGPGRGSAGGSLVAYVLGITEIDPLKFDLYFERFLNPERVSMPDIDIDFEDRRRDEVIKYLQQRWGNDRVANIITYQTIGIKQALRDAARVLNASNSTMNALSSLVPNVRGISTKNIFENSKRFAEFINSNKEYRAIFDLSCHLEGLYRQSSLHAAGVVLTDKSLDNYVPVFKDGENYICGYEDDYLEELGLFKMDILGLKNITIIHDCLEEVLKINPNFKLMDININDSNLYRYMNQNLLSGIFQLESSGMRQTLMKIKASSFHDICDTIALYRPGPRDFIDEYAKRKLNKEKINYPDPVLEDILKDTQGIIIYQEQVMKITQAIAAFSLGKADVFRRMMSKKDSSKLESMRKEFIEGGLKNGRSEDLLIKIFNMLAKFANYGFNKAHTIGYAYIAVWMMHFKVYYPSIFFATLLNNFAGISLNNKFYEYLMEARKFKVKVIVPTVNANSLDFYHDGNNIRFALSQIKGINRSFAIEIINENKLKPFQDYLDFVVRMKPHGLNHKILESLIYAGALDDFALNRETMIVNIDKALSYAECVIIYNKENYFIDYNLAGRPIMDLVDLPNDLEKEKEYTGNYLSGFPLEKIREKLNKNGYLLIEEMPNNKYVKGAVLIRNIRTFKDKRGNLMAIIKASDESGDLDLTLFASNYDLLIKELEVGKYAYIYGKVTKEKIVSMVLEKAKRLEEFK